MGKVKILAVEDNALLLDTLVEQLGLEDDFAIEGVAGMEAAKERLRDGAFDLVLLDVSLPDGDGRDLCRWIRGQGYNFPVLMLTAKSGEMDTIDGLEAGANDYIAKPLRLRELVARIRMHLKQYRERADIRITIGPFIFSPAGKTLSHADSGEVVFLTEKEAAILRYLDGKNGGRADRQELLRNVWGYSDAVSTHTLETHIYRLRRKIATASPDAVLITDDGGYGLA